MKKLIVFLASFLFLNPAFSLDIPKASVRDTNIQYVNYQNNNVVAITGYVGMATHIVFSENEIIQQVRTGFSDGWEIDTVDNHLFVKPKSATGKESYFDADGNEVVTETVITPNSWEWKTNILVVTNKRLYSFLVNLGDGKKGRISNTFRLTFKYPDEEHEQLKVVEDKKELNKRLNAKTNKVINWDYVMQVGKDSRNIAPIKAFDDGRFTYLSFAQNSEIPAVFISTENGKETLVNSHINPDNPNTVVVQRIAKQLVLRLDSAVVGVTNNAFNTIKVENNSGTTIKGVEREVK